MVTCAIIATEEYMQLKRAGSANGDGLCCNIYRETFL